jgi:hypothetical protein
VYQRQGKDKQKESVWQRVCKSLITNGHDTLPAGCLIEVKTLDYQA